MSKPCRASVRRGGLQANRFRYSCSTKTARRSKLRRAVLVDESGLAPESYGLRQSFLHTYSAFLLTLRAPADGLTQRHAA